jgi:hypothetical protein
MNCTAHVTSDACEVWAPTQGQELTQLVVSQVLTLLCHLLRGGFRWKLAMRFNNLRLLMT